MKKIIIINILVLIICMCFQACENEVGGVIPEPISGLTAEPLEGAILLRWNTIDNSNTLYTRVDYDVNGQHYWEIISNYADSLLVSDLLARYGTITFSVTTVSPDKIESSEVAEISMQCQAVKPKISTTYDEAVIVRATASVNSAYDNSSVDNLFDGDKNTIFITPWEENTPYPQWVDMEFDKEVNSIQFTTMNRNGYEDQQPDKVQIQVSNDGKVFTTIFEFLGSEEIPGTSLATYTTPLISMGDKSYKYVRFNVLSSCNGEHFWSLAELTHNCLIATTNIYDPENE